MSWACCPIERVCADLCASTIREPRLKFLTAGRQRRSTQRRHFLRLEALIMLPLRPTINASDHDGVTFEREEAND